MNRRVYLQGGHVLCHAQSPVEKKNILIENGQIIDLLSPETDVQDVQPVDVSNMLIHPGLINAHVHGHSTLGKGLANCWSLELLLAAGAAVYGGRRLQDKHLSTLLGAAELALKGCTSVFDMNLQGALPTPEGTHAVASAYAKVGLRAVLAPMVSDVSFFRAIPGLLDAMPENLHSKLDARMPTHAEILDALETVFQNWPDEFVMIKPGIAPTIPMHCSTPLWLGCMKIREHYNLPMQTHLAESKVQVLSGIKHYNKTLTSYLNDLGALGPHFVAAHCVWLNEHDMELLAKTSSSISHNPSSNTLIGSGLPDVYRMQQHGINVTLGTDGSTCGDNLNMYEGMRNALRVSHVLYNHQDQWLDARTAFQMATENGAKALGIPSIGRIEKGFQADLVFIDLSHPNWLPVNDYLVQLVQLEDATAVHSVMVNGDWVVRNHQLVNPELQKLQEQAQSAAQYLQEHNQNDWGIYKQIAPAVSCFCSQLMKTDYCVKRKEH